MRSIEEIDKQIKAELENMKKPLFSQEAYVAEETLINSWLDRNWDTYAEGYLQAGHALVERLLKTRGIDQDFLIYPILFVYRQYLELRLKELLRSGKALLDQPFDDTETRNNHDIHSLWTNVRPLLEKVWPNSSSEAWYDHLDARISEFAVVDPKSMASRYPDATMAGLDFPNNYINPVHLRDVMTGISHVLEGSSTGIGEYLNHKHEMETEVRDEM